MQTNIKTPKQALNPAFLKQKPDREEIELFKKELIYLLDNIKESESEEFHKNLIIEFLKSVYYKDKYYINTKDRTDLVIHNDKNSQASVGVLVEVKKPANKIEMVSKTNLNVKSFQELVYYYLKERKTGKNFELRHLIITNINEWYVFDAQDFEKLFYQNKTLLKHFEQFQAGKLSGTTTDFFYKEIASPAIDKLEEQIPYTLFDIQAYNKILRNTDKEDDKKLIALYKFLSPTHLLKLPFANDYNQLNKEFYAELLHILGLEEIKEKSQKFIVRKAQGKRDNGSIIENAINELDSMDKLSRLSNINQYGKTYDERLFNIALDLSITWINRILFLKLLESQIIKYHNNNQIYSFLTSNKIEGYDDLNSLFFQILARKEEERREGYLKERFQHVPYLNSSLFEQTDLESYTIAISNLRDKSQISLYSKSVLKGKNVPKDIEMNPLEYLLLFLDAYDFSSEGSEDIQEENKPLISASVLGLIFEKINGYKDGSFFTPSFITMYMCKDTISRTVIQKFNEVKTWNCKNLNDLYNKISDLQEANQIFNSIRLCDPAVGSGHFLVSSLNEMIALKSELGILIDKEGKRLKDYKITVENDELIISDNEFGIFKYIPHNYESQRIQETLFHEKQTIIENCLFGVDINPNSVKICQLRLWIELLKHTYYKAKTNQLETLPNIDINIKCGNSLISRFALGEDLKKPLKQVGYTIEDYKNAVCSYRNAHNKEEKRELNQLINKIKTGLTTEISKNDPLISKLSKKRGELELLKGQGELFDSSNSKEKKKKIEQLNKEVGKIVSQLEEIKNNKIFEHALEWRFEFPEVLNDKGEYIGFDVIIGNPPYIQLQSMGEITDTYKQRDYKVFERTGDIYCLFYELGNNLLKSNSYLSFITSNKWMRAGYGQSMRKYFVEETNPILLIDFAGIKVFDEATVDVNIMSFQKGVNMHQTETCQIKKDFNSGITKMSDYLNQFIIKSSFDEKSISSFTILSDIERKIKDKIEKVGIPLKDWDIQINYGIKTGFNEAFIIDGKTKDELIEKSSKNAEIIRPILRGRDIKRYGYEFADLWLICTFPSLKVNIEEYPEIKEHLLSFGYDRLKQTGDKGARKKTNNKWFETQDSISYWDDFSKQKIVWKRVGSILRFGIDYEKCVTLDSTCFATGNHLTFLVGILNSKLINYILQDSPKTGTGDLLISVQAIEPIRIPYPNLEQENSISKIVEKLTIEEGNIEYNKQLDNQVYSMYNLNNEEIEFIESL